MVTAGHEGPGTAEYKFKSEPFLRHRAEGKVEGKVEGEAEAVLRVLTARGLEVPDAVRERVLACRDEEQLDDWVVRSVAIESAEELFG